MQQTLFEDTNLNITAKPAFCKGAAMCSNFCAVGAVRDFEKAMEMEKEQMICAQMDMFFQACEQPYGITYLFSRDNAEEWAEQYYYETYHSSKQ